MSEKSLSAVDMVMPMFSETMTEGTVVGWLKQPGDVVELGDDLVEIETDKATMTYPSDTAGLLLEVLASEGDTVPVGAVIARIGVSHRATRAGAAAPEPSPSAIAASAIQEAEATPSQASVERTGGRQAADGRGRINASPSARRLARDLDMDLGSIHGSGPDGRIVGKDVEAAASVSDEGPGYGRGEIRSVELTSIERAAARRLGESAAIVPQFELQADLDLQAALELLAGLRAEGINPAPTIGDLMVRIAAVTLRGHRRLNGSFKGDRLELYSRINIGFAVSTDRGLLVPTVFDADQTGLQEITRTTADLVDKARAGKLTASQLGGGTFTISNLGMFGIDRFSALINPPQNAILATGRARKTAVVGAGGSILGRSMMTVTLGCDHRALQGTDGASFLSDFRDLVEDPLPHLV